MDDLISRQAAIDVLNDEYHGMISDESMKIYQIINWLNDLPSAQPKQKTGRWYIDAEGDVRCTVCKTKCLRDDIGINILSIYCPKCGAKTKGEIW